LCRFPSPASRSPRLSVPDRRKRRPRVSVVVCTKNGMPYVREAMASLERQTYRDFEVIVQDAESRDGTAEFLSALQFERLDVVVEPDGGIGDAFNRAFARCSGTIVTTLDADNLLEPDALSRGVELFDSNPRSAAMYGAARMMDEDGGSAGVFVRAEFDVHAVMRCELVPPFAQSFFSPRACGSELRFDPRLKTCADFDLWLRLSHLPIGRTEALIGTVRHSPKSMTRGAENYEQFCTDKLAALDRHVARRPEFAGERDEAAAGIYCWAAESLLALEGPSERFGAMLERAAKAAPGYERVQSIRRRLAEFNAVSKQPAVVRHNR
jgi:glycosyltransferase involved in cell wall biosynthesis